MSFDALHAMPRMTGMVGHIDGVHQGDVMGWVVDRDNTLRAPEVTFVGDDGKSLTFKPHFHRPDVNQANGRDGLFGFAAPVDALRTLGRAVTAIHRDGSLSNGHIDLSGFTTETPAAADQRPDIFFFHIQKTAGTSVVSALTRTYTASAHAMVYPDPQWLSIPQFVALPLHQRRRFKFVASHTFFGTHLFLGKPMQGVTFLRDPIARLRSHYWHKRRQYGTRLEIMNAWVPMHAALNDGLIAEFDNLQVREIAGLPGTRAPLGEIDNDAMELALYNLETAFSFHGFVENIATDFSKLLRTLHMPALELPRTNMRPDEGNDDDDSDYKKIDWQRIAQRHEPEIEFYHRAVQLAKQR